MFSNSDSNRSVSNIHRMAEIKIIGKWLADFLGVSSFFLGWFSNLDNVKSTILFIVGLVYLMVRLFFLIKKWYWNIHKEQQEAVMRDLEIKRHRNQEKEKEIELLERELSIRVTGLTEEERKKQKNYKPPL